MTTNLVVMETMREAVMRLRDHPCTPRWRSVADESFKPIPGNELERVPMHDISVSAGTTFATVSIPNKTVSEGLTRAGS